MRLETVCLCSDDECAVADEHLRHECAWENAVGRVNCTLPAAPFALYVLDSQLHVRGSRFFQPLRFSVDEVGHYPATIVHLLVQSTFQASNRQVKRGFTPYMTLPAVVIRTSLSLFPLTSDRGLQGEVLGPSNAPKSIAVRNNLPASVHRDPGMRCFSNSGINRSFSAIFPNCCRRSDKEALSMISTS